MALVANAVDTMGPSMRVYSTRPLRCRNTFCHRFLLVTSKDSQSRSIWMHTYCRTTHTERGFPTCPHPKVKFIQKLNLNLFSRFDVEIYRGVHTVFSTVFIGKHISMQCSHHKLLLAAGSPEETLRHSKSDWTCDQSVDGTCRRVGAGGRRLNSQKLPVGWNQKPRTSRHLLRNFLSELEAMAHL